MQNHLQYLETSGEAHTHREFSTNKSNWWMIKTSYWWRSSTTTNRWVFVCSQQISILKNPAGQTRTHTQKRNDRPGFFLFLFSGKQNKQTKHTRTFIYKRKKTITRFTHDLKKTNKQTNKRNERRREFPRSPVIIISARVPYFFFQTCFHFVLLPHPDYTHTHNNE